MRSGFIAEEVAQKRQQPARKRKQIKLKLQKFENRADDAGAHLGLWVRCATSSELNPKRPSGGAVLDRAVC